MAEFSSLSVKIAAQTADFTAGMEGAESSLSAFERAALQAATQANVTGESIDELASDTLQAAAAMRGLSSQTENAGDELTQTAIQAGIASGSMSNLSATSTAASVSSANLSTVLVASLVPALIVVASAAVPVVTALGGIVAIGASLVGVGLVGALGAIATNTELLKREAQEVVAIIQSAFAPAIDDATSVVLNLLNGLEDIIPQLVPTEETIQNLEEGFENLTDAVLANLPALVELGVTLAEDFLPAATQLTDDVLSALPGFINTLVTSFERLIPQFQEASRILLNLGPALLDFGFAALRVVGPALASLTTTLTRGLRAFNGLDRSVQNLLLTLGVVAPILLGIATLLGGPVSLAIAGITGAIIGLRQAWVTNFAGIQNIIQQFGNQVQQILPAIQGAFNAFVQGVNLESVQSSLVDLENILGNQLQQTLVALKPAFGDLKTLLQDNKEEFRIIGNAVGFLLNMSVAYLQTLVKVWGPVFRQVIIPTIQLAIGVIDALLTKMAQLIQAFGALKQGNFGKAGERLGAFLTDESEGTLSPALQSGIGQTQAIVQQQSGQVNQRVEVVLDEQTDIIEGRIRESSRGVITDESRGITRDTGTNP